ncbi:SDR family oxidoreductase [Sinomicrobium sp. M5D2P17]
MRIAILGCGWLGFPLAEKCIEKEYHVKGSTTSAEKENVLAAAGIHPYLIRLQENQIDGPMDRFLKDVDTLLVNIPPKLRGASPENFVEKTKRLLAAVENSSVKKLLFISSTSVFGDDNTVITEKTVPGPETESGKQLLAAEQLLQSSSYFQTTILRFAGLIGPDRHPVYHLARKKGLQNPDAPVNLIHLDDCISIILKILQQEKWGETYHAAFPFHPTRKEYYTKKAREFDLPAPEFKDTPVKGKIISSKKLSEELQYTFRTSI